MTIPFELQNAQRDFDQFLAQLCDLSGLSSRHQAYTMLEGVFRVFGQRLNCRQAMQFSSHLPPLLRAVFVANWTTDEPRTSFTDRQTLTREVQSLRKNHNFSPDTCIRDVATTLQEWVDNTSLNKALDAMPAGAAEFWRPRP